MILTAKIKNKSANWSILLKPRITDVVFFGGDYYSNISGINSAVSNAANWFRITSFVSPSAAALEVDKAAGNIGGVDPNFTIDLSADGLPAFPASIRGYVDIAGTGNFIPMNTDAYNPTTKILSVINSPTDFPTQVIKLFIL